MSYTKPVTQLTQLSLDPNERSRYSKDQLQKYFERIQLPREYLSSPVLEDSTLASTKEHGFPLLEALHRYHVTHVPWENLELHYSVSKRVSLNVDDLYDKFVEHGMRYGRGGRCMENNGLFATVLRSLGYDVRNCAGRVSRAWSPNAETRTMQGQTYDNWNHMINLVRIESQWVVADAGPGVIGPAQVLPLEDGWQSISIPPRSIRLQKRSIPENQAVSVEGSQKLWCLDACFQPDAPKDEQKWIPLYCFTETEFLPQDYEMMSYYTSNHPTSFFTYTMVCTKLLLSEDGESVVGSVSLCNDDFRRNADGNREAVVQLKTEEQRLQCLKEYFGIELTDEQRDAIPKERRLP